jgi:hypothetical protein
MEERDGRKSAGIEGAGADEWIEEHGKYYQLLIGFRPATLKAAAKCCRHLAI